MEDAVDAPDDEGADALLHGLDQRLAPGAHLAVLDRDLDAQHAEEAAVGTGNLVVGDAPFVDLVQGNAVDDQLVARLELGEPVEDAVDRAVAGEGHLGEQQVAAEGADPMVVGETVEIVEGESAEEPVEAQAGEHGARIHVDDVVPGHQPLDLAECEPAEIVVRGNLVVDPEDDVAVALAEEAGALLGLQLVEEDLVATRLLEVVEVERLAAFVDLGVVAAGGLERRGELNVVDIARLDLGLQEKVQHAVDLPGEDPEEPDLGLVDDRLVPAAARAVVLADTDALDGEELARLVAEVAGRGIEGPTGQAAEGGRSDADADLAVAPPEPGEDLIDRGIASAVARQQRVQQLIGAVLHRGIRNKGQFQGSGEKYNAEAQRRRGGSGESYHEGHEAEKRWGRTLNAER